MPFTTGQCDQDRSWLLHEIESAGNDEALLSDNDPGGRARIDEQRPDSFQTTNCFNAHHRGPLLQALRGGKRRMAIHAEDEARLRERLALVRGGSDVARRRKMSSTWLPWSS